MTRDHATVADADETREWYERYAFTKGAGRNDLVRNTEVLFQSLAYQTSIVKAVRMTGLSPGTATVLDVGCGTGNSLLMFVTMGFRPEQLCGVDIQPLRVDLASDRLRGATISCADATHLQFGDSAFDIVTESTMFMQVTDESLAAKISGEMLRVSKSGGFILLADWRYADPRRSEYRAL